MKDQPLMWLTVCLIVVMITVCIVVKMHAESTVVVQICAIGGPIAGAIGGLSIPKRSDDKQKEGV